MRRIEIERNNATHTLMTEGIKGGGYCRKTLTLFVGRPVVGKHLVHAANDDILYSTSKESK